jgi:hypothetical protein
MVMKKMKVIVKNWTANFRASSWLWWSKNTKKTAILNLHKNTVLYLSTTRKIKTTLQKSIGKNLSNFELTDLLN